MTDLVGCGNWMPKNGIGPFCANCGFHEREHRQTYPYTRHYGLKRQPAIEPLSIVTTSNAEQFYAVPLEGYWIIRKPRWWRRLFSNTPKGRP